MNGSKDAQAREGMARKGGFRSSDPRVSLSGKPAGSKAQLINVSDEVKKKTIEIGKESPFFRQGERKLLQNIGHCYAWMIKLN